MALGGVGVERWQARIQRGARQVEAVHGQRNCDAVAQRGVDGTDKLRAEGSLARPGLANEAKDVARRGARRRNDGQDVWERVLYGQHP